MLPGKYTVVETINLRRTVYSFQRSKLLKDGILKLWYMGAVQHAFEFIKLS